MFGKIVCAFKRWRSRRELVKGYGLDAKVLKANVKMAKNLELIIASSLRADDRTDERKSLSVGSSPK